MQHFSTLARFLSFFGHQAKRKDLPLSHIDIKNAGSPPTNVNETVRRSPLGSVFPPPFDRVTVRDRVITAPITFAYHDGGRKDAGYQGKAGDCVTRSIAIATGLPYQQVYDDLNALGSRERIGKRKRGISSAGTGVYKQTIRKYLHSLSWNWVPTMHIGSGCKVHLRADELPSGRLIVNVSRHTTTVIEGVVHDTHDCSREGTRCVYGYWTTPEGNGG